MKGKVVMNDTPEEVFKRVDELKNYGLEVPFATELAWQLRKEGVRTLRELETAMEANTNPKKLPMYHISILVKNMTESLFRAL